MIQRTHKTEDLRRCVHGRTPTVIETRGRRVYGDGPAVQYHTELWCCCHVGPRLATMGEAMRLWGYARTDGVLTLKRARG